MIAGVLLTASSALDHLQEIRNVEESDLRNVALKFEQFRDEVR